MSDNIRPEDTQWDASVRIPIAFTNPWDESDVEDAEKSPAPVVPHPIDVMAQAERLRAALMPADERALAWRKLMNTSLERLDLIDTSKVCGHEIAALASSIKAASDGMRLEEGLATDILQIDLLPDVSDEELFSEVAARAGFVRPWEPKTLPAPTQLEIEDAE